MQSRPQKPLFPLCSPYHKIKLNSYNHEEENVPFRPFHIKFSRLKHHSTSLYRPQDPQDPPSKSQQMVSKRVYTETQTNDLYASDFEQESHTTPHQETVQQQNQPQKASISAESGQAQIKDSYQYFSESTLKRKNQRLIDHIQYMRSVFPQFKLNVQLLEQQRRELKQLRALRSKAMDYSYELSLDKQSKQKKTKAICSQTAIKHCSAIFQKQKYQRIQKCHRESQPTQIDLQLSQVDLGNPQANQMAKEREELLAKKREFYRREERLQLLQKKIEQYTRLLDIYETRLSRGNLEKLQDRKHSLQNEIATKETMFNVSQIQINLDITTHNNEIALIETRLIAINEEQKHLLSRATTFIEAIPSSRSIIKQTKNRNNNRSLLLNNRSRIKTNASNTSQNKDTKPKGIISFLQRYRQKAIASP